MGNERLRLRARVWNFIRLRIVETGRYIKRDIFSLWFTAHELLHCAYVFLSLYSHLIPHLLNLAVLDLSNFLIFLVSYRGHFHKDMHISTCYSCPRCVICLTISRNDINLVKFTEVPVAN